MYLSCNDIDSGAGYFLIVYRDMFVIPGSCPLNASSYPLGHPRMPLHLCIMSHRVDNTASG